ncbi:hemerythrin domain-containing protein [Phycicoccus avicenniae]|uniref:hemerythrin domain-containing protein n=1 Tax=Phycicoccus avicenniae TaxID=2828860 RepID=UPI003D2964BC
MAAPTDPHHTMNHVIHRALRRDLERLEVVTREPLDDARRAAVCAHVTWLLDFLHHHHVSEDEGVWPLLLRRRPDLAPMVEEMNAEHAVLAAGSDRLRAAAAEHAADGSDAARRRLHDAVVGMQEATLPHLEHEEAVAMVPLVESLSPSDWDDLSRNHFRKGLSFADSGTSLMWDLDDADAATAATVRSEVPGPVLWLLTRLFGGRYDRAAAVRWGPLAGTRA